MRKGCSHGKGWFEVCWECRLISINRTLPVHEAMVERLRREKAEAETQIAASAAAN